ncbi:4-hydroxy-tetrahydrodipicolinate synthase [Arenicella xantha]|uniref:4-hydroxy-tetrahydrodipicolinate synthase n=1 Tax=Arenicella xantha TaxID=644221 RepID=A0A395JJQ7_9GAMM|nr:4-hydroxy-tetrahydrodipicolinate synthase [Arenicella xantha]RBP50962.1 4-hydroxy-tetrahydrodipicolinate synthase [Arenicella xantha]
MKLEGSIVALITPMQPNGAVDFAALTRLIEFHVASGTHGIVAVGTTGESATLTVDEHLAVIEYTIKTVDRRIPVIAGTGANSTSEAIHLTKHAERLGADAALIVVPYYNKPTQAGLIQHFSSIAKAVPIPQILYNVPGRTVADLSNDSIAVLADIDNIVGCKDATGDLARGRDLVDRCGDRLTILSGDDPTALEYMQIGARGDISVTANVAPSLMSQMCEAALAGKFDDARQLDLKLRALHRDLFVESNPIPVKYAVSKMGYTANVLRLPLTPLSPQFTQIVDAAMHQADVD